ncbi:MAG: hypothetical protein E7491_06330 [Ruminococcaceae bacterium]|nr:hypothetical protein [Oscillospiraceae bacterium]
MKKVLSIILTVAMCAMLFSGIYVSADTPSDWAVTEVNEAVSAGLVPEHINSKYQSDITRSDFCDLIINMIEKKAGKAIADVIAGYADAKADVSFPDTTSANVIAAAKLGIVNGRASGAFDPSANITRQEAAKMLALGAKVLGEDITATAVDFADASTIYDWAKDFIYYVNGIGVMKGTSTTTPPNFSPLRTYTREQSILTVLRLFKAVGGTAAPVEKVILDDNFESGSYNDDMIFSFSDINVIDTNLMGGQKAIQLAGGERLYLSPSSSMTDEKIVLKFKMRITEMPATLEADQNFQFDNEIFHICADETGRIGSGNYWSAKFRAFKESDSTVRYFGYLTDVNAADSMVMDAERNSVFNINETHDFEITFEPERCYISMDGGKYTANFGNARNGINDFCLYTRTGVTVLLDDFSITTSAMPTYEVPANIKKLMDANCITGYLDYHVTKEGLIFDRLSHEQKVGYGTSSLTMVNTCMTVDMFTNTRNISISYKVMESGYPSGWTAGFDVLLNGVKQNVEYTRVVKNNTYTFTYTLPENAAENNRLTVYFPPTILAALSDIKIDDGAKYVAVPKAGQMICIGDSITEGSGCISGASVYINHVARAYNLELLNQAVSGWSFSRLNIMGEYEGWSPKYVFIGNGTNNFAGGVASKDAAYKEIEDGIVTVVEAIHKIFPEAKIIGLTPIHRHDAAGVNYSLKDVANKMKEVYARYSDVTVIDCYDFCPDEDEIHPSSAGHDTYGQNLLNAVKSIIGATDTTDWQKAADEALK